MGIISKASSTVPFIYKLDSGYYVLGDGTIKKIDDCSAKRFYDEFEKNVVSK